MDFYFSPGPNPLKVALFLEEGGLAYTMIPVDIAKGDQFAPEFVAINPNSKVPALIDGDAVVFDSNAILLYLADKTNSFLPEAGLAGRAQLLSWLMFVASGVGPYSGQAVHFRHFAPEPKGYGVDRYTFEARRHYGIIDAHLAGREWMLGDRYTIVDMALWGWARMVPFVLDAEALGAMPELKRVLAAIDARPAAARAVALKDQHAFKIERDDEFRRNLFKHVKPV